MANEHDNIVADAVFTSRPDVDISLAENLVSILIPCVGQLEYTKLCVPSVLRHSRSPFELIFLDIGSLDGTSAYLAGIAAATSVRVEIVRTATDAGIADAVDEALTRMHGQFLALLNNDTIVTDAWLNQLVALLQAREDIGLVGPMSNYAAPPQLVEHIPYRVGPKKGEAGKTRTLPDDFLVDVRAVDEFAAQYREEHKGKWMEVERLGGFCLLLRRQVLNKIQATRGLRDWTDLRLFDTDILSNKARQAGFALACCRDLYVHHFGSRIFAHGAPQADAVAKSS